MPNLYILELGNSNYLKGIRNSQLNQRELGKERFTLCTVWLQNLPKTQQMKPLWETSFHAQGNKSVSLCRRQFYCKKSLIAKLWYTVALAAESAVVYVSLRSLVSIYAPSRPRGWPPGTRTRPAISVLQPAASVPRPATRFSRGNRTRPSACPSQHEAQKRAQGAAASACWGPQPRQHPPSQVTGHGVPGGGSFAHHPLHPRHGRRHQREHVLPATTGLRLSQSIMGRLFWCCKKKNHDTLSYFNWSDCLLLVLRRTEPMIFLNGWIWGNANFFWQLHLYWSVHWVSNIRSKAFYLSHSMDLSQ